MPAKRLASTLVIFQLLALSLSGTAAFAGQDDDNPRVVVMLHSHHANMPWSQAFNRGTRKILQENDKNIVLYDEYIDTGRFSDTHYYKAFYQYLQVKYSQRNPRVLLADSQPAHAFLEQYPDLMPGAQRIVFQTDEQGTSRKQEVDGSWNINIISDFHQSVEEMLRLAEPRNLYVIVGTMEPAGEKRLIAFRSNQALTDSDVRVHYLINIPLQELNVMVSQLPPDSAIYYLLMFSDMRGNYMTPYQIVQSIAQNANAPVFSHWQSLMGSGILGGYMISGERIGALAGRSVLSAMNGGNFRLRPEDAFNYYYDWRQLNRWGIAEKRLMPGTDIINRPASLLDRYQVSFIVAAVIGLIILLFSFLIYRHLLIRNIRKASMRIANTDSLTGLNNRRAILPLINKEMARCNRFHTHACLLIVDVDHFKMVNDNFGHLTGDQVLRDIAEQLAACLRVADTVARWGGEEFIVLAPATDIDQGREIGEKLRKAIEAMSQVHGKTTTISVGVAAYIEGETFNSWCDRADDALYKAKESGRNQVVISDIKYSVIPQEQGIERQVDAGIYAADQTVKDDGSGEI